MSYSATAVPVAVVEIYPYEGGNYTIFSRQPANILSLTVSKSIRGGQPGQFTMQLAPGGPQGPNVGPLWTDLLTPMSLCIIGLGRMDRQQIVMVGVVVSAKETTTWVVGRGVQRSVEVQGMDFGYIFQNQLFYLQTYLLMSNLSALPTPGLIGMFGSGLLEGAPDYVAASWYSEVMAGANGVVADLLFAYQGTRLSFSNLMSTFFETFPANISIPYSSNFLSSDGSWQSKFDSILPAPFYECFVSTSPIGYYNTGAAGSHSDGKGLTIDSLPSAAPVTPVLVGRVNPFPTLVFNGNSLPTSLDTVRWNALPTFVSDTNSFINSEIINDAGEVRNFYLLNPVAISNQFGGSNSQTTPFLFSHAAYVDPSSIHRFGLRPQISELEWLNDPTGGQAQNLAAGGGGPSDFDELVSTLALKQVSYYEPTALMRRASVTDVLRPDIMPGTRYIYPPHKDGVEWLFYVEAVTHNYNFGGYSTTTLTLSRGLPLAVYNNLDLLLAIHLGNAQTVNGQYVKGLPVVGSGIEVVNAASIQNGILGQVARIFNTPQGGTP